MAEAVAKVSIDATGYTTGADKITKADAEMAASAKAGFSTMGESAERAFSGASIGADKAVRSYKELAAEVQRAGRAIETENKRIAVSSKVAADTERAGGHGSNRGAGLEVGHSVRSIVDMAAAGQDLGRAFGVELPRVLQASGAGLGVTIGIEVAAAIARGISTALQDSKVERENFGASLVGGGNGTRVSATSALRSQMEEVAKARDEIFDSTGNGKAGNNKNLFQFIGRNIQNGFRNATGQQSVEDETDSRVVELENKRIQLSDELAKRKAAENQLEERAFSLGKDTVAVDKEKLATRERIQNIVSDPNLDATAKARMIDTENAGGKVREAIAQIGADDYVRNLSDREAKVKSRHPDLIDQDGSVRVVDTDAEGSKVNNARIDMDAAKAHLTDVENRGGDDRDAKVSAEEKTAALVEAANASHDELDAAKAHTAEMRAQMQGQASLASLESISFSYQKQRTDALRDGKTELAAQLQLQGDIVEKQARMRAYFNPAQGQAERRAKQAEERAEHQFDSTGGLTNVHRDASGNIIDGIDPITGERRAPTAGEAAKAKQSSGGSRIKEAAENRGAGTFDEFFHHKSPVEQDRAAEPPKPSTPPDANAALTGQLGALVTQMQNLAAKIGVA